MQYLYLQIYWDYSLFSREISYNRAVNLSGTLEDQISDYDLENKNKF